ncbi:hypothetical protein BDV98DRAFT_572059 [Pterulicium gracile]|uniref:F-box domain-containing protein n=1 Tax=Pterulicium gracile TaxID=1884261 RepID=A0A5C3QCS5_9AGAR|nr:hypothetical protein BDV98DRAFT_572059 [Pterula gracilis]
MPLHSSPTIPPELWRQVFFEVSALQQQDLPFVNSIDASLFPWVAARVSREWRAICLAEWCRKLWAQVSIDEDFVTRLVEDDTRPGARQIRMMKARRLNRSKEELELEDRLTTQLSYAGDSPLFITLDVDNHKAQEAIMRGLWTYRSTWKEFKVEESPTLPLEQAGSWNGLFEGYCDELVASTDIHFPNLSSISFSYSSRQGADSDASDYNTPISSPQCALELFQPPRVPVLTEVRLHFNLALRGHDEYSERFPWDQLQALTLEGVPSSFISTLFPRIGPNIRELNLQMAATLFQTEPGPPPPCTTFSALSKLTIDSMKILPLMSAPALKSISFPSCLDSGTLDHEGPTQDLPNFLSEFVQRSGCSLLGLTLSDVHFEAPNLPQQFCAVLQASPELQDLELADVPAELISDVLGALSASQNAPGACSRLKHLVIVTGGGTLDEVAKMVETRRNVDQRVPCSTLESVRVEEINEDDEGTFTILVHRFSGSSGLWSEG